MRAESQHCLEQAAILLAKVLNYREDSTSPEHEKLRSLYTSLMLLAQTRAEEPFSAWLRRQRDRRDPVGDLARLAELDPRWPQRGLGLTPYADRLRLTNLTKGGPHRRGAFGAGLIEHYLYPAWDEYVEAARRHQLQLVRAVSANAR